jgi:hypothetical protein
MNFSQIAFTQFTPLYMAPVAFMRDLKEMNKNNNKNKFFMSGEFNDHIKCRQSVTFKQFLIDCLLCKIENEFCQ